MKYKKDMDDDDDDDESGKFSLILKPMKTIMIGRGDVSRAA